MSLKKTVINYDSGLFLCRFMCPEEGNSMHRNKFRCYKTGRAYGTHGRKQFLKR